MTKTVFTPVDYQVKFEELKKHIVQIEEKPTFINELVGQDFAIENYSKLKAWLKARDTLVVWAAIARHVKVTENNLNILGFPNIEATVEKAKMFGDWCIQNAGRIDKINSLYLKYNQLSNLPREIWNFSQLENLYLSNNHLRKLPKEIDSLSLLKELSLHNNQLTKLPKKIGKFSQLQYLSIADNQLTKLPTEIGSLSKLRFLYLRDNPLKELPEEIENLELLGCRIIR